MVWMSTPVHHFCSAHLCRPCLQCWPPDVCIVASVRLVCSAGHRMYALLPLCDLSAVLATGCMHCCLCATCLQCWPPDACIVASVRLVCSAGHRMYALLPLCDLSAVLATGCMHRCLCATCLQCWPPDACIVASVRLVCSAATLRCPLQIPRGMLAAALQQMQDSDDEAEDEQAWSDSDSVFDPSEVQVSACQAEQTPETSKQTARKQLHGNHMHSLQ
jgi:hypothetical protein